MNSWFAIRRPVAPGGRFRHVALAATVVLVAACEGPTPRTFADFMEDRIAREGTIAHCNEHPEQAINDIECANARRAAAAIALRQEREMRAALEEESRRKIAELEQAISERERIAREAALEALRAEEEAYEARWRERAGPLAAEPRDDRLSFIELPATLRED